MARFETEADPDGILPPWERAPRAEAPRGEHLTRMPLRSAAQSHRAKGVQLIARADEQEATKAVPHMTAAPALEEKHDDYIRRLVDAAPPLTPEQFDRLAALMRTPHGSAMTRTKRKPPR